MTPQSGEARPLAERFWEKVDKRGPDECWPWLGARVGLGYGLFKVGSRSDGTRRDVKAHRVAWTLTRGPIPRGEGHHGVCVLHRCDNPPCCNPAHLLLGSHADNMAERDARQRTRVPAGGR